MVEHEKTNFTTSSDNFVKVNYPYYLYVTIILPLHQTNFGLYKFFLNKTKGGSSIHKAKQGANLSLHLVLCGLFY